MKACGYASRARMREDTYGLHLPLLAGTEVSIAFEEGNPTGRISPG